MQMKPLTAGEMLQIAVNAIERKDKSIPRVLDKLPAAIYVTDSQGILVHYNRACVAFAGRTPHVGQDSWCVTWKLYTEEGEFLPHDQCPMAVAIRERRAVRGVEAVAERPDGTHVRFRPHPTPLLDEEGNLTGAINLLLDVTGLKQAQTLRAQAARCRRIVNLMHDQHSVKLLASMAAEYDQQALRIEQTH
jgi:PAS domain S-box-containing protein